jgi:F-type H+-transporting ATPase subunit a
VASEPVQPAVATGDEPEQPQEPDPRKIMGFKPRTLGLIVAGIILVVVIDIFAFLLVPPFDPGTGEECSISQSTCLINGTLHFPEPYVIWTASGEDPTGALFEISITDTLFTMVLLTVALLIVMVIVSRGRKDIPGLGQNFVEWAYESLASFGRGMGGSAVAPYVPIFALFFVLILTFNWSGLVPPIGLVNGLRAPTSDLNVTIGLALVAFFFFQWQGFARLGGSGYLSKFFPFYEFKNGIGAGLIALFVGFIELILEFIKPVTLSVRLFGNIYGGEVALAVITSLAIAIIPVAIYGLEIILTFVQALIFSTLALVFTLIAVEPHHHEEGHVAEEMLEATHPPAQPATAGN